jgi:hypothetical protein
MAIGGVKIIFIERCLRPSRLHLASVVGRGPLRYQRLGLECLGHDGKRGTNSSLCKQEIRFTVSEWCASDCMGADQELSLAKTARRGRR